MTSAERAELVSLGIDGAAERARPLIVARLGPAEPVNDGRQTPWHGFPSFPAQHATATCCRACLSKHHGIPTGLPLDEEHLAYIESCIRVFWEEEMAEEQACDCRRCRQGRGAKDDGRGARGRNGNYEAPHPSQLAFPALEEG